MDMLGGATALLQIFFDHYRVIDNPKGFWQDLNYGKFLLNLFSASCCCIFVLQHFVLYKQKCLQNYGSLNYNLFDDIDGNVYLSNSNIDNYEYKKHRDYLKSTDDSIEIS